MRLVHFYGREALTVLEQKSNDSKGNQGFGVGFFRSEMDYLTCHEWAEQAEDILWRRTKLGLYMSKEQQKAL